MDAEEPTDMSDTLSVGDYVTSSLVACANVREHYDPNLAYEVVCASAISFRTRDCDTCRRTGVKNSCRCREDSSWTFDKDFVKVDRSFTPEELAGAKTLPDPEEARKFFGL
jgi:hypothetical protein